MRRAYKAFGLPKREQVECTRVLSEAYGRLTSSFRIEVMKNVSAPAVSLTVCLTVNIRQCSGLRQV
jgi:hypothetical protein